MYLKKYLIFTILILIVLGFSGLVIDIDSKSINNANGFGTLEDDVNNYIIVDMGNNITLEEDTGTESVTLITSNDGTIIYDSVVSSDGFVYIATNSGIYRRNSQLFTPHTTSQFSDSGLYTLVTAQVTDKLVSKPNYIYYNVDNDIYKINVNTKLTSFVVTPTPPPTYDYDIVSFDVASETEIYFIWFYLIGGFDTHSYVFSNLNNDYETLIELDSDSVEFTHDVGIQYLGNNKIYSNIHSRYVNAGAKYNSESYILNNTGNKTVLWSTISYNTNDNIASNFYIGENAFTAAIRNDNQIEIIATNDKGLTVSSIPSGLEYDDVRLTSLYDTYYNNSKIQLNYYVDVSLSDNDISYSELVNNYDYEIDLVDNNNVPIEQSVIITPFGTSGIINRHATLSGTQVYTGTYNSGNWSANLYEVNQSTNARALIANTNFEILNSSSTSIIDTSTDDDSGIIDRLFNNPHLDLMIILLFFGALGSKLNKSDDDKTFSLEGAIAGFIAGFIIAVIGGMVATWIIYLVFFIVAAVIAVALGSKMT